MGAYIKRLMVAFRLPGARYVSTWRPIWREWSILSILPRPYAGEPFPGHDQVNDTFGELEVVIAQRRPDWQGALQHMKGVYAIHDQVTGKPYVGSAYGDTGIWARLGEYAASLHGGNLVETATCAGPTVEP